MKHIHQKTIGFVVGFLITSIAFGQQKQLTVPNFVNPFQSKISNSNSGFISPINKKGIISDQQLKPNIEIINGSFSANLVKERLTKENALGQMAGWLGLSQDHVLQKVSERTDELAITHTNFQHFFKGFLVDGDLVMLHSKNELITSINGNISNFTDISVLISLSIEQAKFIAKDYLKVSQLIIDYPVETVITKIPNENGVIIKLAHKVRIDSYKPFTMCYVYVDAETGAVLNKINLNAHADVAGKGPTIYSGSQSITVDNYTSGNYRLRESGRKIETYDATTATGLTASGLTDSKDFTNNAKTFDSLLVLKSFSISKIAQSWWYSAFVDQLPDLYIQVKDGSKKVVYVSGFFSDKNPTVIFDNLNLQLMNPPYTIEVWDKDAGSGDDFGGSYSLALNVGTQSWSGSGNAGSYDIEKTGHPAIDVHWGMEMSYDFYLNVFKRSSYDGFGSVIKQYINPPDFQVQFGGIPNNASAYPPPYNFMVYGLGDGIWMNPVVGLDVEGHEFSHLVVGNNGNGGLTYQGESGALNESFADIFGTCIEFYSGVNTDWLIGEDIMVSDPFLRSMSNPNDGKQPDTYKGQYWSNTSNLLNDKGGVHTNSGVQNFWFYLLCQGGSGKNDLNVAYSVTGIGISKASAIAYRNLINYLSPNATYLDAFYGSLQAAEDLYGSSSPEYKAARNAWFAVGIGVDPNDFCDGITKLTAPSGKITDGSGSANYNNNSNCKWVIAPAGATQISVKFTSFDTEADYDSVFVYDGPDESFPILATWWGNTLPPLINTSLGVGAMCIKFTSDDIETAGGWSADYQAYGITPSCGGGTILSTPTGTLNDGSGLSNYGNNQQCYWFISPPCASSVTLSFSQFNTELNYDFIIVYDGWDNTANQLAVYSGTSIPSSITSNTGKMLVVFVSDYSTSMQGFSANYSSSGSGYCSGTTNLYTSDYATFTDGSGANNYCNNQDCKWLIQPPDATSITLKFTSFELEDGASDGTIYDAIEVYDGTTTSAKLLGRFSGSNLPPAITSSGGGLLVRFVSDIEENKQGFSAYYTSTQNAYCSGSTTTLLGQSGTFSDGSGFKNYSNNTTCSWLIQPLNATDISLTFTTFNTEQDYDGVIVYDGSNNAAPVLGQFSGTTIPSSVTSTGGSMLVEFLSDPAIRGQGWTAKYSSKIMSGISDALFNANFSLYPNPTNGMFTVNSGFEMPATIEIFDVLGKQVLKTFEIRNGTNQIDATELSKGVYMLRFKIGADCRSERLVMN